MKLTEHPTVKLFYNEEQILEIFKSAKITQKNCFTKDYVFF